MYLVWLVFRLTNAVLNIRENEFSCNKLLFINIYFEAETEKKYVLNKRQLFINIFE